MYSITALFSVFTGCILVLHASMVYVVA